MKLINRFKRLVDGIKKKEKWTFWSVFLVICFIIIILAHTAGIGYKPVLLTIPENRVWDLNKFFWFPYHLANHPTVWIDFINTSKVLPPQQYQSLYFVTFVYWITISLFISKGIEIIIRKIYRSEGLINERK